MTRHEKNQIDILEKKLDKILFYLLDDPETNSEGLVSTVKKNTDRITENETKEKVKNGKVTVLSMVGGAAVSFFAWLFS